MLDQDNPSDEPTTTSGEAPDAGTEEAVAPPAAKKTAKKAAAKKTAKKAASTPAAKKTAAKRTTKKAAAADGSEGAGAPAGAEARTDTPLEAPVAAADAGDGPPPEGGAAPAKKAAKKAATKSTTKKAATKKTAAKKATKKTAAAPEPAVGDDTAAPAEAAEGAPDASGAPVPLFQAPTPTRRKRATKKAAAADASDEATATTTDTAAPAASATADGGDAAAKPARASRPRKKAASPEAAGTDDPESKETGADGADEQDDESGEGSGNGRRRRRRGGRRRRRSGGDSADHNDGSDSSDASGGSEEGAEAEGDASESGGSGGSSSSSRRRRRRRRSGEEGDSSGDDPENTTTRVRKTRSPEDEITALSGSTRLEAKKQRRREGREAGRRRAPIVSEAEFLARREAVDRVMVIRQHKDLTQIAVMEDKVLVEHYVARESQTSLIGNVYLGRVQNVLPSMEAAFIDIGKGRNAVLYAGEVNWDTLGAGNGPRKIEQVLKSGQPVLVQVTKDPVGHKGARLTSQISLPGRFLVYVPDGTTSGISRKLPDTERNRLKTLLKEIVPDTAGVIVRTAAEGASEDELTRDVERLTARWEDIAKKAEKGNAPQLLYGEPDLTLKVVRDLFTEDFRRLVVSGDDAWDMVENYVGHVAPDLAERLERWTGDADGEDAFAAYRIDEQIAKALDRKVWLPSGGSLIIDRTEAMTVVDVNTGKFTGSGGNLEETVTKNNLEAAEEIVRQLRLRDIGGIIVVDFIDMVLESNRDLVLRRLVECLGRDRTRHQVAEVTSLGLVQMTRKRIGTGLLEAFSESCEHCQGRGLVVHHEPIEPKRAKHDEEPRRGRRSRGGRGKDESSGSSSGVAAASAGASGGGAPSPKELAAMAKAASSKPSGAPDEQEPVEASEKPEPEKAKPQKAKPEKPEPEKAKPEKAKSEMAEPEKFTAAADTPATDAAEAAEAGADAATTGPDEPVVRTSRRARRGSSRRAAGPPSAESTTPVVVPETPTAPDAAQEPAAAAPGQDAPQADQAQVAEDGAEPPAAARVVTSSRRRVARRPAGPPAGGSPAADGAGTPAPAVPDSNGAGDTPGDEDDAQQLETAGAAHVPVKRKGGGRKR